MKRLSAFYKHFFFISSFLSWCLFVTAQSPDPFKKIKPVPEKLTQFHFGEIKPTGWLKTLVQEDLDGFVGHLDSLAPDLIIKDDIYGKKRLTKKVKAKDLGVVGDPGEWQVQFLWWNSETQGNWWDGYIRTAILANDPIHLKRVKAHVTHILSTQDADGYIGIYDNDLRYRFKNENGELWAKSTILRGLLAWYEYTKDAAVLKAIQRAVQNVMTHYPLNASRPFYTTNPNVGGLSHGLTFTDVLERLYQLTGKQTYLDYALFLYKDFSRYVLNEDGQFKKLLDTTLLLKGHGVHTYEHLRSVAAAYYASGNPALKTVLERYLRKITLTTTPSGAGIGDEWIGGGTANATNRGYEYCSLHELVHGYTNLFAKSGDPAYGDKTEKLFFNAALGARHPEESSIAYLKTDNSYIMTGGLNGDTSVRHQVRYKYSPVHQDAAVCCSPNAGRIAPYYIHSMWMKDKQGFTASVLGPCEFSTSWQGKRISIQEITAYPYDYSIAFEVEASDATFDLRIRKPVWANEFSVSEPYEMKGGFIVIRKKWNGKQTITVDFHPVAQVNYDNNREAYFTYGPLVLAHSIDGNPKQVKTYALPGFRDLHYTPQNLVIYKYNSDGIVQPDKNKLLFTTRLINPVSNQPELVELRPMGKTILRQVTFK